MELASLAAEVVRLAYKVRNTHAIFNNWNEDKERRNAASFMDMVLAAR